MAKASGFPEPIVLMGMDKKLLSDELAKSKWDAIVFAGTPLDEPGMQELFSKVGNTRIYAFQNLFNFMRRPDDVLAKVVYPHVTGFKPEAWADFEIRYKYKYKENTIAIDGLSL